MGLPATQTTYNSMQVRVYIIFNCWVFYFSKTFLGRRLKGHGVHLFILLDTIDLTYFASWRIVFISWPLVLLCLQPKLETFFIHPFNKYLLKPKLRQVLFWNLGPISVQLSLNLLSISLRNSHIKVAIVKAICYLIRYSTEKYL